MNMSPALIKASDCWSTFMKVDDLLSTFNETNKIITVAGLIIPGINKVIIV